MNIKTVNIYCNNCKNSMKIQPKYLINKNNLLCINCENEFPQTTLTDLKNGINSLMNIEEHLKFEDSFGQTNRTFSVKLNYE